MGQYIDEYYCEIVFSYDRRLTSLVSEDYTVLQSSIIPQRTGNRLCRTYVKTFVLLIYYLLKVKKKRKLQV